MKEDVLLTSPLEYTNEPYAIAKIAGLKTVSYTHLAAFGNQQEGDSCRIYFPGSGGRFCMEMCIRDREWYMA